MADRAHQMANVDLAPMGVRHDRLNDALGGNELDNPITVFIPEPEEPCSPSQMNRPPTQSNV